MRERVEQGIKATAFIVSITPKQSTCSGSVMIVACRYAKLIEGTHQVRGIILVWMSIEL